MPSNLKVAGVDLDAILEPRTSTARSPVGIKVNGTDIAERYEISTGGDQLNTNTGYKVKISGVSTDLRYIFKKYGASPPTPQELYMYYVGNGSGTTDPSPAGNPHAANSGDVIVLSATSSTGSQFAGWTLSGTSVANPSLNYITFTMPSNTVSASATFSLITSSITTQIVPSGVGTITITPPADAPGGEWYYTTNVNISATVTSPYHTFQELIIDSTTGLPNNQTIGVANGHSISAVFTPLATATITSSTSALNGAGPAPGSPGTVSITPAAPTSNIYLQSTTVTATATPASYYDFAYFVVDVTPVYSNPYSLAVGSGHNIIAVFEAWPTLVTSVSGGVGGSVTPPGTTYVEPGSTISVQANASPNYSFVQFVVDGVSIITSNPYVDSIGGGHTVAAVFEIWPTLTTSVSGGVGGSVTPSGSTYVQPGSTISVQANASAGYEFGYFLVDATVITSNPYVDGIGSGHTVVAAFIPVYTLTTAAGTGGSVSGNQTLSAEEISTNITATEDWNYDFTSWSWSYGYNTSYSATSNPVQVVMPASPATITANFGLKIGYLTADTDGNGTAAGGGAFVYYGSTAQLTATPDSGYIFDYWEITSDSNAPTHSSSLNSSTANPVTVTVNGVVNVRAHFVVAPPEIPTSGLIMYVDAGSASSYPGTGTTWYDLSGSGNNVTISNFITYTTEYGGGLVSDGSVDPANVTSSAVGSTAGTICYWMKSNNQSDLFNTHSGGWQQLTLWVESGYLKLRINDGDSGRPDVQISPSLVFDNTVHFVCATWSTGGERAIWIDGVKQAYLGSTVTPGKGGTFEIGYKSWGANRYNGKLYAILSYNRALSDTEINDIYDATKGRFGL